MLPRCLLIGNILVYPAETDAHVTVYLKLIYLFTTTAPKYTYSIKPRKYSPSNKNSTILQSTPFLSLTTTLLPRSISTFPQAIIPSLDNFFSPSRNKLPFCPQFLDFLVHKDKFSLQYLWGNKFSNGLAYGFAGGLFFPLPFLSWDLYTCDNKTSGGRGEEKKRKREGFASL